MSASKMAAAQNISATNILNTDFYDHFAISNRTDPTFQLVSLYHFSPARIFLTWTCKYVVGE